jgi:integrase
MAWVVARKGPQGTKFKACYRDPSGAERSAGTYLSRRVAERAGQREEQRVREGRWHDSSLGAITFRDYVEKTWLPSKHIELTTRAAYQSNLDKHFFPFFGDRPMGRILPSNVQEWVTMATAQGLAPRSVRKYHVMLHSIFRRAVRDQLILTNPCEHTELPKVVLRRSRTLTPEEFDQLIRAIPEQHRLMVETAMETGMRWGELIALRPRHIDFLRRQLTVEETIIEVSKRHSPTSARMIVKPYPKDNEARTFGVREQWLDAIAEHISSRSLGRDELLFGTEAGTPISRNTFRTRIWLPAVKASGLDFNVRMHDLRHAHASWLLAGGADLKGVMERMGHAQIQTTQKYLHTLPETDRKNIDAFSRIADRRLRSPGPTESTRHPF